MEQHNYTFQEIRQMFAETAKLREEDRKQREKTNKEINERFRKTEEMLKRVGKQFGNIGHNNGAVAEDFFYRGFDSTMQINNVKYNYIERNKERKIKDLQGEYDIVLTNNNKILVVEVKYNLHIEQVKKFYEKKLPKFKQLFPEFKDYTVYGAMAGLSVPNESLKRAEEYGFMVFTQSGENLKKISSDKVLLTKF